MLSTSSHIPKVLLRKNLPRKSMFLRASFTTTAKVKSAQPSESNEHLAVPSPLMSVISATHKIICILTTTFVFGKIPSHSLKSTATSVCMEPAFPTGRAEAAHSTMTAVAF